MENVSGWWTVAIAVGVPGIAANWRLARLEGRVDGHETDISEIKSDVRYVRERIDKARSTGATKRLFLA